jgi:hypothetical protein
MRVLARSKSGATVLRRHRNNRPAREPVSPEGAQPERSASERGARAADAPAAERPLAGSIGASQARAAQRRRREPSPEDHAVYSCECGFVFEADVSTSVGCPHCGGSQAW